VGNSISQQVTTSGSNVYVVWQDNTPGNYDIFFARNSFYGAPNSWANAVNLSSDSGDSESPSIVANGSYVYVVWVDVSIGAIYMKVSVNWGQSFGSKITIAENVINPWSPHVATIPPYVYVIWSADNPAAYSRPPDIYFKRSTNYAMTGTWGSIMNVSNDALDSERPQIAVSGNNVYLVWEEFSDTINHRIKYARSTNNGESFNASITWVGTTPTPVVISSDIPFRSVSPSVETNGFNSFVFWYSLDENIYFRKLADFGETLGKLVTIGGYVCNDAWDFAVVNNYVYVAWQDFDNPCISSLSLPKPVHFRRSTNNGDSFASTTTIADDTGHELGSEYGRVKVEASGSSVYVVIAAIDTQTDFYNFSIYSRKSSNNGLIFGTPVEIGKVTAEKGPNIKTETSGGYLYTVWSDLNPNDLSTGYGQSEDIVFMRNYGPTIILKSSEAGSSVFEVSVEDKTFDIRVTGEGVVSLSFNEEEKMITLANDATSGTVEIEIPKELLGGDFTVMADANTIEFKKSETDTYTTLLFEKPADSNVITIQGTTVIPEFPVAIIVFASVIAIVLLSIRFRLTQTIRNWPY
jgi:hypothetical protein